MDFQVYLVLIYYNNNRYKLTNLKDDLITGLTMGIIVIPQGLAYAGLAGLPPEYGLYCCILPPLVYMIFGTCPQANVGVFALVSMLSQSGVESVVEQYDDESEHDYYSRFADASMELSFYVGIFLLVLGIFHFGWITCLLSDPCLSSFTTAAEFNIAFNQIISITGVKSNNEPAVMTIVRIIQNWKDIVWYSVLIGVINIIILIPCKRLNKRYCKSIPIPFELILVIINTAISSKWNFKKEVKVIGEIPSGFPPFKVPKFKYMPGLLPHMFILGLIAYVLMVSVAKNFSQKVFYYFSFSFIFFFFFFFNFFIYFYFLVIYHFYYYISLELSYILIKN